MSGMFFETHCIIRGLLTIR